MQSLSFCQFLVQIGSFPVGQFPEKLIQYPFTRSLHLLPWISMSQPLHKIAPLWRGGIGPTAPDSYSGRYLYTCPQESPRGTKSAIAAKEETISIINDHTIFYGYDDFAH